MLRFTIILECNGLAKRILNRTDLQLDVDGMDAVEIDVIHSNDGQIMRLSIQKGETLDY